MIHHYHHRLSKIFFLTGTLFFLSVGSLIIVKELSDYIPQSWKNALYPEKFYSFQLTGLKIYKNDFYDPKQAAKFDSVMYHRDDYYPEETIPQSQWHIDFKNSRDKITYISYNQIAPLDAQKPLSTLSFYQDNMELPDDVLDDNFDCTVYNKDVAVTMFRDINFRKLMTDKNGRQKENFKITSADGKVVAYLEAKISHTEIID